MRNESTESIAKGLISGLTASALLQNLLIHPSECLQLFSVQDSRPTTRHAIHRNPKDQEPGQKERENQNKARGKPGSSLQQFFPSRSVAPLG
jgi:hypothetical protein